MQPQVVKEEGGRLGEAERWTDTGAPTGRCRMSIRGRERQKKKDMKRSAERNGTGRRGTERVTDVPAEVS